MTAPNFTALTFNLKVGVDSHPQILARDILRIEKQRGRLDLVSLQEVGRFWQMGVPIHQARYLASVLAHSSIYFAPALTDALGGQFGVALTASTALEHIQQWRLPQVLDEQRTVFKSDFTPPGWTSAISVWVTHLSIKQAEREAQAAYISELTLQEPGPMILLGDLNDLPDSLTLNTFKNAGFIDHWQAHHGYELGFSFSVKDPNRRIDYLLTRGLRCTELELLTSIRSSDHFPLWGRFELGEN